MKNITCYKCQTVFGMSDDMYDDRLEDGEVFSCPQGHRQHFSPSHNSQLRDEIKSLKARLSSVKRDNAYWRDRCNRTERSLSATKGVVTKLQKKLKELT